MEGCGKFGFSEEGEYFCYYCVDGKLKVWDIESGTLKQEYTPNLHLSSPVTSLVWLKLSRGAATTKKKRTSTEGGKELHAVALGTASGRILIYSVSSNEVSHLKGPSSSVNSLSWIRGSNLFSCAGETILEWTLSDKTIKSKWKGGKNVVTSLLVLPEGKGLLSAARTIILWSLPEHEQLKSFTGHASDVCSMVFIPSSVSSSNSYFISAAKTDRYLSAWCLDTEVPSSHVAQFITEDTLLGLSTCTSGTTKMAVVTHSGVIHLYSLQLNGKCQKPIKPDVTIHIASSSTQSKSKERVMSIPIIGGKLCSPTTVLMAYGTIPFVEFEKIIPDYSESALYLVRQEPKKPHSRSKGQVSKVVEPEVSDGVHYVNQLMDVNQPPEIHTSAKKRGHKSNPEVPMEERLNNLSLIRPDTSTIPRADNAAQLLSQALQSKDKKLLQTVLYKRDESVIKRTVSRLPVQVVVQLLQELASVMQNRGVRCQVASLWLRAVISVHASQIMANPVATDCLGPIFGLVDTKLGLLHPLLRLRGRLDLLLDQLTAAQTGNTEATADEGLLVYQDSYSSEENLGEEIAGNSDVDENWDEFSEVDEVEESEKDDGDQDDMSVE